MEIKKASYKPGSFLFEKQLEDFIIENWDRTEFGKKYDLIISQQYPTFLFFKDKKTKNYVVIELKKNQNDDYWPTFIYGLGQTRIRK